MTESTKYVKGERPVFLESRTADHLIGMNLALVTELTVLRDRLDSLERLLESCGTVTKEAVENYQPSPAVIAEREARYAEFLDLVFQPILQERAEMERKAERKTYSAVAEYVETS